jgi:hypothetical protein
MSYGRLSSNIFRKPTLENNGEWFKKRSEILMLPMPMPMADVLVRDICTKFLGRKHIKKMNS